jgi:protease-4
MGDVAASGGYYISMNSNEIVAEPQTITGSIGVVGMVPNLSGFMQWIGINPQRLTRGKRAAGFQTMRGLDDEDKQILREHMEAVYGDFVAKVAAGRGKAPAEIQKIARGRIWTGRDAQRHGLVDRLGGLRDAVALAREKGGIAADLEEGEGFHVLEYPRRAGPFEFLEDMFGMRLGLDKVALSQMPLLRRALVHLEVFKRIGADRVALAHPELTGLANPFGTPDR